MFYIVNLEQLYSSFDKAKQNYKLKVQYNIAKTKINLLKAFILLYDNEKYN